AARMGRVGSLPRGRRPTFARWPRLVVGLAVGCNLFLWNMLVAHLSDDPLRTHFCLAGLSTSIGAHCPGRSVPRPLQLTAISAGRSFWSWDNLNSAASMGFM